jgi:glutamyl-tRNA synthetase
MRIEDIDHPRVVPGAAESICRDHEWLGLDWDEGPIYQSTRDDAYERALTELRDAGFVYPCTCSRKEIAEIASAPHDGEGPRYPGTCRHGVTRPDRAAALRFRFDEPSPGFDDLIFGPQPAGGLGGDFVLRRADGTWAYQFAVVVDDADGGITEVIRGADLLSSTPRQIGLYRALRRPVPRFAHVGLVVDPEGRRLSKRHGAAPIETLRDAGVAPEVIIGRLGYSLGMTTSASPKRAVDLLPAFEMPRIPRAAFIWDAKG